MRLYLDRNLVKFGRREASLGFRLTGYVDGLGETVFDRVKDWQNSLQSHLNLDQEHLRAESEKLVQDIHRGTEREWDGYHCFIGIHNMHAQVLFVPIESKDTPYNETGWCSYSSSFAVDVVRVHMAFSEENTKEYAVYFEEITRQYEDVRLFLYCNVLTSCKALQSLAYVAALRLGNYRELQSDCLEYCKAVARLATTLFTTEYEITKSAVTLSMHKLDLRALDDLTVTNLKSEAISRRNPASRYPALSSILSMQATVPMLIVLQLLTVVLAIAVYHYFFR